MSGSSDYEYEMGDMLSDEAIEAFLLGVPNPAWQQDEALASLAVDVSTSVRSSLPSPDHALLQLFWTGWADTTQASDWSPSDELVAEPAGPRPSNVAPRRRLRLLAGLAGGLAAALLGAGAAGATGVLPDPAQRVVARVVEAVSPFEVREQRGGRPSPVGQGRGEATIVEGNGGAIPATNGDSPPPTVDRSASQKAAVPGPEVRSDTTGVGRPGQTPAARTPAGGTLAGQTATAGTSPGETPLGQRPGGSPGSAPATGARGSGPSGVPSGGEETRTAPGPGRAPENPAVTPAPSSSAASERGGVAGRP